MKKQVKKQVKRQISKRKPTKLNSILIGLICCVIAVTIFCFDEKNDVFDYGRYLNDMPELHEDVPEMPEQVSQVYEDGSDVHEKETEQFFSESFEVIAGKYPIIISAPHAVKHMRNNAIKANDIRTGVLVQDISNKENVFGIYKTGHDLKDPNFDEQSQYRDEIVRLVKANNIKALVDLHGMHEERPEDICIGINRGINIQYQYNLVDKIVEIFKKHNFKNVSVDKPFGATGKNTVSAYVARNSNIPAIQIEINRKYRAKDSKEFKRFPDLEKALCEIAQMLNKSL